MLKPKPGVCHCGEHAVPVFIKEEASTEHNEEAQSDEDSHDFRDELVKDYFQPDFSQYRVSRSVSQQKEHHTVSRTAQQQPKRNESQSKMKTKKPLK